jgi:hypothetical protein
MASPDLEGLTHALASERPLKPYQPEDRDAEAAKIAWLRELRLGSVPIAGIEFDASM